MEIVVFQILNGLVFGLVFALIALGLNLIYGLTGLINIAHGSFYMLGAVAAYLLVSATGSFWLALVVAPLTIMALLLVVNSVLFERISQRPLEVGVLATVGLLLVVDNTVLATFGGAPETIPSPLPGAWSWGGVSYPIYRLFAGFAAILTFLSLYLFLNRTPYGLWMRAMPQSPELAAAIGIPLRRVSALTVGLGGLFAGLAGALSAPIFGVYFEMGIHVLALAFIVVVVGGLGSIPGAIVVGIVLGISRGVFAIFLPPTSAEILAVVVLAPMLVLRPNGIFGKGL